MKTFSFSLDRVLAWRRLQLEQERAALQKLLADAQTLAHRAQAVQENRRAYERSLSRALHFDAFEVATLPHWQSQVKHVLTTLAGELQQLEIRLDHQRARHRAAEQKVKLLERLRDRRLGAWRLELSKEEEAFATEAHLAGCFRLKELNRRARSSGG